jgi:hypothetical protein
MVRFLENFVVQCMDFRWMLNIVVVNMEHNIVVNVELAGLFLFARDSFCLKDLILFSRFGRNASHFGWIVLVIVILLIVILLWARRNRRRQSLLIGNFCFC